MTRFILTLKQHRFEIVGAVFVCLGLAAAALFEAWQLNSIVLPKGCDVGGGYSWGSGALDPCTSAVTRFYDIRNGTAMTIVQIGLIFGPFLVAILLGAPLVAREVEQGTAPLSWALVGSRRRWLLVRVACVLVVLVPLLLALGLSADVLYGAMNRGTNPWASFDQYGFRGVLVVFWGLAAYLGTAALGTLFGRSMPAVFLALIICLFARIGGEYFFQKIVLAPYAQPLVTWDQMVSGQGYGWTNSDLALEWRLYLDGKPFTGDVEQWYAENTPPWDEFQKDPNGGIAVPTPAVDPNASPDPNATPGPIDPGFYQPYGPQSMPYGFHGDRYWPVVITEATVLLLGSLLLAAVSFFWVGRRRPH